MNVYIYTYIYIHPLYIYIYYIDTIYAAMRATRIILWRSVTQLSIAGYMRQQKPGTTMMCAVRQSAIVLPKERTLVL